MTHVQVIDCLLKTNSFDIDIRDFSEKTPLHYAALNGADEVVYFQHLKLLTNIFDLDHSPPRFLSFLLGARQILMPLMR